MTWVIIIIVAVALFVFLSKKNPPEKRPQTKYEGDTQPRREPAMNNSDTSPSALYQRAKDLALCLFDFPYQDPSSVPPSVRPDKALMNIIVTTHKTTIGTDGKTQQTTIDPDERIRLQAEFKKRISVLLDKCLAEEPDYAPALLLYPKVAEWNTRAGDRKALIELSERLLPGVERVKEGTKAYSLIEKNIEGMEGNYFEKVERHLADFYFDLGQLYLKENRYPDAITQFQKSINLMPLLLHFYCGLSEAYVKSCRYTDALALWEKAEKLPIEKTMKDAVIHPHHEGVKESIRKSETLREVAGKILPSIEESPGILQKDLYKRFAPEEKSEISSLLYRLDKERLINREKKGNTYRLTLIKSPADVLAALRGKHLE